MNPESSEFKIRVLFFAKTRELSQLNEAEFVLQCGTIKVSELKDLLCSTFHLNSIKQNLIIAINEEYCGDLEELLHLRENDEIALIPPISGG